MVKVFTVLYGTDEILYIFFKDIYIKYNKTKNRCFLVGLTPEDVIMDDIKRMAKERFKEVDSTELKPIFYRTVISSIFDFPKIVGVYQGD